MNELLNSKRSSLLASLASQNMTLKVSLIVAGLVILFETIGICVVGMKRPLLVGLTTHGPEILNISSDEPTTGPQMKAFVFEILSRKFPPQPTLEKLVRLCPYFTDGLKATCTKELSDKKSFIPQDFLVKELIWNEKTETAHIQLKRFVTFNGSLTSIDSLLNLRIIQRSRTSENPWGLFIDSWKEEVR